MMIMQVPHILERYLSLAGPFNETFGFVDKMGSRETRVSLQAVIFALSSKVAELIGMPDLRPMSEREILIDMQDSLFRGELNDVRRCLERLKPKYVKIVNDKSSHKEASERVKYIFTEEYQNLIKKYAEGMWKIIAERGGALSEEQWLGVARLTFDFFRYRYTPEWYLLGRRLIRLNPDESKRITIRQQMFSNPSYWLAINYFLIWRGHVNEKTQIGVRNYIGLRNYIAGKVTNGDRQKATNIVTSLEEIGICNFREDDGMLLEETSNLKFCLEEYIGHITKNLDNYIETVKKFVAPRSL